MDTVTSAANTSANGIGTTPPVIDVSAENAALKAQVETMGAALEHYTAYEREYQQTIEGPPVSLTQLYAQACSGDGITLDSWYKTWLDNIRLNNANFKFTENSAMQDFGKFAYHPAIIAGSGPSLRKNAKLLVGKPKEIPVVSCLHNFGYLEDIGAQVEYYLNLDAGDITISEMSQGGKKSADYYWDLSKDRTLVTAITGHPELIKRWKGRILFYSSVMPHPSLIDELRKITDFNLWYSVGGNTLGACMYHARCVLGCQPIAIVGADFAFSREKKFHSWDSPYDKQFQGVMPVTDVFGNRAYTWKSYWNFKTWFDWLASGGRPETPGIMINCTEGGILGAYAEGNIKQIQQMPLGVFLECYRRFLKQPEIKDLSILY